MLAVRSLEDLPEKVRRDREFGPAVYLLGSPLLADKIPDSRVKLDRRIVDWEWLIPRARGWSMGEKMYLALAFNLWSGNSEYDWIKPDPYLNPYRWASTLSDYSRFIEALGLSGGLVLAEASA